MAFVTDTFTDSGGTNLTAHTGETGATWTKNGSAPGDMIVTDANRIRYDGTGAAIYYASGTPATAEYDVEATIRFLSTVSGHFTGVVGRTHASDLTYYLAGYDPDAGAWTLYKRVDPTYTSLGTFSQSLSANTNYAIKLEIRDAAKKVYIDGVERISSGDNEITATGKSGVFGSIAASNSTGMHIDDFSASDPAAGGSTPSPAVGALSLAGQGTSLGFTINMPDEA